jgi:hypothetical protein
MNALNTIRRWLSILSGKPTVQVEDHILEHLLVYHGLIGTGTDTQPQFVELANTITNGTDLQSTVQLSSALKVPPLWWDDHLLPVFEEIAKHKIEKLTALFNPSNQALSENDLLNNDDWRVRANTANVLALLNSYKNNASEYEQRLIKTLSECTNDPFKPAFVHVSYALAKLQTDLAKQTLLKYLHDPEPWFRVDAARALSLFPVHRIGQDLLQSLLDYHPMLDYTAMVITRVYNINDLVQLTQGAQQETQEGLCELILGVIQATKQSAFAQLIEETKVASCLPQLAARDPMQCSARHIRVVLQLGQWLAARNELDHRKLELFVQFRHKLASTEFAQLLKRRLTNALKQARESDIKHTIALVGELHLGQLALSVIPLLSPDFVALDEAVTSLAQLADLKATEPLIQVARQLVNFEERTTLPASAQPVIEVNPAAAKSYWLILGVLGRLPEDDSLKFLCQAAADFAPDKRANALRSIVNICSSLKEHHGSHREQATPETAQLQQVKDLLKQALNDPASEVKKVALQGVAELHAEELLPYVRKNCGAKERSLSEVAFAVFRQLYAEGMTEPVLKELKKGATWTLNSNLRERYVRLAAALSG